MIDVRIHCADEARARGVLGSAIVQIDRDPPRAFLEDGVTKAPEIQVSVRAQSEERVVAALRGAGLSVYASRTRPEQGAGDA